jgi:DNA-binding IclR family transcriptional regulator
MTTAAHRLLDIFALFATERRPLSVSEMARLLEIPVSTCHGLVKALEARGYMAEAQRLRAYYPTKLLLRQATEISSFDPTLVMLGPKLARLRNEAGETVLVGKRVRLESVYLDVIESQEHLRFIAKVGELRPLYATAAGKALLGAMHEKERASVIARLKIQRFTSTTVSTREQLAVEINEGVRAGYFNSEGGFVEGTYSISVPVQVHGEWLGVVIAGPRERVRAKTSRHVKLLKSFKNSIEIG